MRKPTRRFAAATVCVALSAPSAAVLAGAADVQSSDGQKMKFEYGDDRLRINMSQPGSYMLVLGDQVYVVTDNDGQVMVVSLNQAMHMFGNMAASATPDTVEGKLLSLKATGRKETLAGIEGEVYQARYLDHNGKEQSAELVLSDDRRAREFQQAMFGMARSMASAADKSTEGADQMYKQLEDMNKGILRYGDDMRITALSDRKIDDARFVLPAEPTDLSALQGVFGGGQAGSGDAAEGGLMGGILGAFGKKSATQAERVENRAEREVDREASEATDNVLDKAFDKLFGK